MTPAYQRYARNMKVTVVVPDDLFAQVERVARRSSRSRSDVYRAALREYLARHAPDEITMAINRVVANVGVRHEAFARAALRRSLSSTEW